MRCAPNTRVLSRTPLSDIARRAEPILFFRTIRLPNLKLYLVDGGYLESIPQDPLWPDRPYRYTTAAHDGQSYGLLFHLERGAGPTCRTGVKTDPNWWAAQPESPF